MTDNEIVKAWGSCLKDNVDCAKCPLIHEDCHETILDLINRQKAEIEELKSKNSNLTSDLTSLQNDLTSAKAEIEMDDVEIKELRIALQGYLDDVTRVRNLYKKSIEELNQAKAEIERLKATVDSFTDIGKLYSEIKSEAYRGVAAQLEAEIESSDKYICEYDDSNVQKAYNKGLRDALKVVKELVGDDDA